MVVPKCQRTPASLPGQTQVLHPSCVGRSPTRPQIPAQLLARVSFLPLPPRTIAEPHQKGELGSPSLFHQLALAIEAQGTPHGWEDRNQSHSPFHIPGLAPCPPASSFLFHLEGDPPSPAEPASNPGLLPCPSSTPQPWVHLWEGHTERKGGAEKVGPGVFPPEAGASTSHCEHFQGNTGSRKWNKGKFPRVEAGGGDRLQGVPGREPQVHISAHMSSVQDINYFWKSFLGQRARGHQNNGPRDVHVLIPGGSNVTTSILRSKECGRRVGAGVT